MRTSYSLNKEKIRALGNYWNGAINSLSPFQSQQRTGVTDAQKREFEEIGLLDHHHQITRNAAEILKIFALPSLKYIIGYVDAKTNFKICLYQGAEKGEKCIIISRNDTFVLFYPCITDEIFDHVKNTISIPLISTPDPMFNLSLSRNDAAVMAVLIDIQRQSLSDQNQKAIAVNSYEIFEILRNYEKKPLKWPILTLFFEDIPFDTIKDEDIKKSLSRFFAQGYLSRSGEGYALDPALLSLSRNLVPTTFALLISGITRENSREAHEVNHNIFGGSGSILRISTRSSEKNVITMDTVGSDSVNILLWQIIESPDSQFGGVLPGSPGMVRADAASPAPTKMCPDCGNLLSDSAKFCRNCGAAVAPEARPTPVPQCPQCGSPVKTGAKFCSKCGKKFL